MKDISKINRVDIYIRPNEKVALIRKANKLGLSLSKLLVQAALDYEVPKQ
jgi:hypothetical protein